MNTNSRGRFHEVLVKEEELEEVKPLQDVRIKEDTVEDAKFILSADNPPTYSPPSMPLRLVSTAPSNYLGPGITSRWEVLQLWLQAIWNKLPAIPSGSSCRGWAYIHSIDPLLLDNWFNNKLHTRVVNGMLAHPQDRYDLDVHFPLNRLVTPAVPPGIKVRTLGIFSTFPFAWTPSYLDALPRPNPRYGAPFFNPFATPRSYQNGLYSTPSPLSLPTNSLSVGINVNPRMTARTSMSPAPGLLTELNRKRKAMESCDSSATTRFESEDRSTSTFSLSFEGPSSSLVQSPDKKRARTQEFEDAMEVTDATGKSDPIRSPNIRDVPTPAGFPSAYDSDLYLADPTSITNFQAMAKISNTINSDLGLWDPAVEGLPMDYSTEPRFELYTEWL